MNLDSLITQITGKTHLPKQSIHIKDWQSWYKGNVKNFHNYRIFNGENEVNCEMKSMQMAKFFCETWADLLLNEKCEIVLPEKQDEIFQEILKANNFKVISNQGVEKSFALGIGAIVLSINDLEIGNKGTIKKDNTTIGVQFIDALKVRPITVKNGIITECAFESNNSDGTVYAIHIKKGKEYVIHNYKYDNDDKLVDKYEFATKSMIPYFQIIKPNTVNNLNDDFTTDELAMSVFGNAIDGLKDLDAKYDSFYNEGILGRRRIYLGKQAYQVDIASGEKAKSFDPFTMQYYFINQDDDQKPLIQSEAAALRYDQQVQGINAQLNYVGMKVGFGSNFFRFDGTGVMTATQVISENSSLFRRIKKHELVLKDVLLNLTKVIIQASNEFTNNPIGQVDDEDITILFDDSIIEDTGAEKTRDKEDVASGLMSREEYRMKWYGEDEDTAKENVRKYFLNEIINNYLPALTQGGMTPKDFVVKVYGEEDKEKIEYITNFVNQGSFEDYNEMEFGKEDSE